ncbi:Uncharacterized protein SCG7086_BX_00120 [Chlamydiales bacterium SCGC AG-110-P3]|nr:Uncharacterized protein SCG7086_BX_00120 [Chlamydiales bacterium SCGC AG-110-P3]
MFVMQSSQPKKNKVNLSDYNYQKDIKNRLWISSLSPIDIEVLREVVYGSIKTKATQIADLIDRSEAEIRPTLSKLKEYGLVSCSGNNIEVSKDVRKDLVREIEKYEEDFHPGIPYLRKLLGKVPMHILPSWYSVPRMADNIVTSIIEKSLETPKAYREYLSELDIKDPVPTAIAEEVFASDDFMVRAHVICERYELSREQLEEYVLLLEFNLVCCISPIFIENEWVDVITPFSEWREYLRYIRDTTPIGLEGSKAENIKRRHPSNFGFIEDLEWILNQLRDAPASKVQLQTASDNSPCVELSHALNKLLKLEFISESDSLFHCTSEAKQWMSLGAFEKSMDLYRNPLNELQCKGLPQQIVSDRNHRLVERALLRIIPTGWVTFDAFMESIMEPIGSSEPSKLERIRAGEWRYSIPQLSDFDRELVRRIIFDRLYEIGITTTGTIDGKDCFSAWRFVLHSTMKSSA